MSMRLLFARYSYGYPNASDSRQNANDADDDGRRSCNVCPPDVNQCLFLASAALNRLIAEQTKYELTLGLRKQSTLKGSLNLILLGKLSERWLVSVSNGWIAN